MAAMELVDGQTLTMQGENGVVFDQDVPKSGTQQREVFEYLIRTKRVLVLGPAGDTEGDEAEGEKPRRGRRATAAPEGGEA